MTTQPPDLAEMRATLVAVADFLEDEADMRAAAGSEMSDYEREPRDLAERLDVLRVYLLDRLTQAEAALSAKDAEIADLKRSVIAFCAPWAVTYARDHGLPEGHLAPSHYDILERCGARMADFTRAALTQEPDNAG